MELAKFKIFWKDVYERGVVATADIAAGEVILFVPHDAIMWSNKLMQTQAGATLQEKEVIPKLTFLHESSVATIILLESTKSVEEQTWKPLFDAFPENFDLSPLNYSEEELSLLKGSLLANDIKQTNEAIKQDFEITQQHIEELKAFTLEDYKRNWIAAQSRFFSMNFTDGLACGLVPIADMFNHSFGPNIELFYNTDRRGFQMQATANIKRGNELFINYMPLKNDAAYLMRYGMVHGAPRNPFNTAAFTVSLDEQDPLYSKKLEVSNGTISYANFHLT